MVGYRVPVEWHSLSEEQRGMGWVSGFKRSSRAGFCLWGGWLPGMWEIAVGVGVGGTLTTTVRFFIYRRVMTISSHGYASPWLLGRDHDY